MSHGGVDIGTIPTPVAAFASGIELGGVEAVGDAVALAPTEVLEGFGGAGGGIKSGGKGISACARLAALARACSAACAGR